MRALLQEEIAELLIIARYGSYVRARNNPVEEPLLVLVGGPTETCMTLAVIILLSGCAAHPAALYFTKSVTVPRVTPCDRTGITNFHNINKATLRAV